MPIAVRHRMRHQTTEAFLVMQPVTRYLGP